MWELSKSGRLDHNNYMQRGKKYRGVIVELDRNKEYSLQEALEFVKAHAVAKFDESVEVHVKLGINPKKGEEQVRSTAVLPHGVGRSKKIAVVTTTKASEAQEAGADLVGGEELIEEIKIGKAIPGTHFDVVVATPEVMPKLASIAKILGPKGIMPNPKTETVTPKVKETVEALKKGSKVSFKNDDSGNVHQVIGKLSFTSQQLEENFKAFFDTLQKVRPETMKGRFVRSIAVCSTMGPGLKVKLS
jgi:large subunit ribosomal protein L1